MVPARPSREVLRSARPCTGFCAPGTSSDLVSSYGDLGLAVTVDAAEPEWIQQHLCSLRCIQRQGSDQTHSSDGVKFAVRLHKLANLCDRRAVRAADATLPKAS